ncbi:hypothetical protein [Roseospira marina]|uniref:hypothetical protein n=1 Tax=Roseospira marina TaxID=140057 RepID=UPI0017C8A6D8|nr:hypothetical protein [Roseospira marina]MBB5086304.1 hypothetical protein [Roseospira marina]
MAAPETTPAVRAGTRAALAWAVPYFQNQHVCSTAQVTGVAARASSLVVRLDIDPRWARDLAGMADDLRGAWFALHCPFVREPVWRLLPEEGDIVIETAAAPLGWMQWSCRHAAPVDADGRQSAGEGRSLTPVR